MKTRLNLLLLAALAVLWIQATAAGGEDELGRHKKDLYYLHPRGLDITYHSKSMVVAINKSEEPGRYAYAPSIMYYDGKYHLWACSEDGVHYGDTINYRVSADGMHWRDLGTVLSLPRQLKREYAHTCDPAVVRYQAPADKQPYFYLFFSSLVGHPSNPATRQGTVNSVARALIPGGPYHIYMGGDPSEPSSWVNEPQTVAYFITESSRPCYGQPACYGAGQPTVVVKDRQLFMWFWDSTVPALMHTRSTDGVNWETPRKTNVITRSVTIKYHPTMQSFVMLDLNDDHSDRPSLEFRISDDGEQWSDSIQVSNGENLPRWIHNIGMSGDERGWVSDSPTLVGFGGAYDLSPHYRNDCAVGGEGLCWGYWDLIVAPISFKYIAADPP